MSSSTVGTILQGGVNALGSTFATLLPLVLPVAIALAVLFGILYWIMGAAHRR